MGGVDWRRLVGITRSRLIGAAGVHREALLWNWNTTNHPHLQVSEFSTNIIDYSHTVEIFCTVYNIFLHAAQFDLHHFTLSKIVIPNATKAYSVGESLGRPVSHQGLSLKCMQVDG